MYGFVGREKLRKMLLLHHGSFIQVILVYSVRINAHANLQREGAPVGYRKEEAILSSDASTS